MSCKSCGHSVIKSRKMCNICLADYDYNRHRRKIEKKQILEGKPISQQWARKPRWDYQGELKMRGMDYA